MLVERVQAYPMAKGALGEDGILVSYGAATIARLLRGLDEIADVIRG